MMFDCEPLYFVVLVPGLVLALWALWHTQRAFRQGKAVVAARSITGAQAAAEVLQAAGATGVAIEPVAGGLTHHYAPHDKVLRLSPEVYYGQSLAALGVAAHEAGHALQDTIHYPLLRLRNGLVWIASLGGLLFWLLLIAGLTLIAMRSRWSAPVLLLGLGVCVGTVVLQLVTLPVEFDASNRARRMLVHSGMITAAEDPVVKRVLHAAVATHVATILMSTLTPRCFFIRTGLSGRGCEVDSRRSALPDAYGSMQDLVTQHDSEAGKRQT